MRISFLFMLISLAARPCFAQRYSNRYFSHTYNIRQNCEEPQGFFQKLFSYFSGNSTRCSSSRIYSNSPQQLMSPQESIKGISPMTETPSISQTLEVPTTSLAPVERLENNFKTKQATLETIIEEEELPVGVHENETQNLQTPAEPSNLLASPNEVSSISSFTIDDTISEITQMAAPALFSNVACVSLAAIFVPAGIVLALEEIYLKSNNNSHEIIKYSLKDENGLIACQGKKSLSIADRKNKPIGFEHGCQLEEGKTYQLKLSTFDGKVLLEEKYVASK